MTDFEQDMEDDYQDGYEKSLEECKNRSKPNMTNSEAKATPRPWKISSCEHNDNDIAQIIYGDIYGGGTIAKLPKHKHLDCIGGKTTMYRNKGDKELAEANASLIVKAVNNHEALLEACRCAFDYSIPIEVRKDKVYQAIANAEGK